MDSCPPTPPMPSSSAPESSALPSHGNWHAPDCAFLSWTPARWAVRPVGRAQGCLAPAGEVETRDIWLDLALESLQMYPEYVAQLEAESGVSIDYRRCGAVEVA